MEVTLVDPHWTNPGPIDVSVLYDQEKHVSSAVWDGQVWSVLYHLAFTLLSMYILLLKS